MSRVLLHTCCAPCSVAIIDELRQAHDVTVFFYNPNIRPADEYQRRKTEVRRVCTEWGIPLVDADYEWEKWERDVSGIPQDKEGGARCSACYRLRLLRTAEHARELGFDQFASSLAMGRQKKSVVINAIGNAVATLTGLPFLDRDWKKAGRFEKSLDLIKSFDLYRQKYCGCRPYAEGKKTTDGVAIKSAAEE